MKEKFKIVMNSHPLASYAFGTKELKMKKHTFVADRPAHMKVK